MSEDSKKIFAKNLIHYMEIYGVSRIELCKALGLKYTTLRDWLIAESYPRIDKIEALAEYFNINVAYLVEDHENLHRVMNPAEAFTQKLQESKDFEELFDIALQADLEELSKILEYAKFITKKKT